MVSHHRDLPRPIVTVASIAPLLQRRRVMPTAPLIVATRRWQADARPCDGCTTQAARQHAFASLTA